MKFVLIKLFYGGHLLHGHQAPVLEDCSDDDFNWAVSEEDWKRSVTWICDAVLVRMGLGDMEPFTYYEVELKDEE